MGKRELVALLYLSSWCLVMVGRLFLAVPWGCLRFVIVVFPDHTHLLFLNQRPCPYYNICVLFTYHRHTLYQLWTHFNPNWKRSLGSKTLLILTLAFDPSVINTLCQILKSSITDDRVSFAFCGSFLLFVVVFDILSYLSLAALWSSVVKALMISYIRHILVFYHFSSDVLLYQLLILPSSFLWLQSGL